MRFSDRKLPKEAATQLKMIPVAKVKPFQPLLAPAYLYLRANEKFVSVKGPLDFFTREDLQRLAGSDYLFFPKFINHTLPYRDAGAQMRTLLQMGEAPLIAVKKDSRRLAEVKLPPSEYEISDASLRLLGTLWGTGGIIEPFFVAVFVGELCDSISEELMDEVRNGEGGSVERYEYALLLSAWVTFLALHLGSCDRNHLSELRSYVFQSVAYGSEEATPEGSSYETHELVSLGILSLANTDVARLSSEFFSDRLEPTSRKLAMRFKRIADQIIVEGQRSPSIYGMEGFIREREVANG